MAQRRMFSPDIVESEEFLTMPISSQALYFHLGMAADDDGFVQPKLVMRLLGANEDDLKVLLSKRFLLPFECGVVVIKHWLIHNMIRSDRYKTTRFQREKNQLEIKKNKAYTEKNMLGCQDDNQMAPQVRLGKVRLGKVNKTLSTKVANDDDFKIANLLLEKIKQNMPTFKEPSSLDRWADDVRKMRTIDGRTVEQIEYVIGWCQKDTFWQANILSMKTLRKQFDKLVAQIKRSTINSSGLPKGIRIS